MTFRIDAGGTGKYCDGITRRSFVQLGVAGLTTLGLGDVLRAKAQSAPLRQGRLEDRPPS